jgi:hypothetical protein
MEWPPYPPARGSLSPRQVEHSIPALGFLPGASNLFELEYTAAIALVGRGSPAALATVVGVLDKVPAMPSICGICSRMQNLYLETFSFLEGYPQVSTRAPWTMNPGASMGSTTV